MRKKNIVLDEYLFGDDEEMSDSEKGEVTKLLEKEIQEIFECENF